MGPADWEQWLHNRLERPVEVKFNRSRTMPLRFEDGDPLLRIRMHRFFQAAPEDVAESMARWITSGRRARPSMHRPRAHFALRRTLEFAISFE